VLVAPDGDLASLALSYHSRVSFGNLVVVGEDQTFELRRGQLLCNGETIVDVGSWEDMMRDAQAAQDREFLDSLRQGRAPSFTIHDTLPTMRILDKLSSGRHTGPIVDHQGSGAVGNAPR
jgi:2-hydroxy-4-carboxymuconate semialdehyde hemiacetal dehydrogenase